MIHNKMDKLTESQRASITKMNEERLRAKLVKAGYTAEMIAPYSRAELMNLLAEVVAARADQPVEATAQVEAETEGDIEVEVKTGETITLDERRILLEERKLQVEERRWMAEREDKIREMEEKRLERELRERELVRQKEKEEREMEEKRREREYKENAKKREMDLKERELELKRIAAEKEESYRNCTAAKLKLWGDALRNTVSRMPAEPIEIVSWFIALEKLFDQLQVPDELRAVLLRPYLNEKAKVLLARCDLDKTNDYKAIKIYLLCEMRLSPGVHLEKFNAMTRDSSETFQQLLLDLCLFMIFIWRAVMFRTAMTDSLI